MAVTAFPSGSPDHALLNVARFFTRLEHNLLSPGSDRSLQSEYQRMRVNKVSKYPMPVSVWEQPVSKFRCLTSQNVEYARTLLTQLERSLPQLKSLDRKHEAQAEIARDKQLLKRIQTILDEEDAKARLVEDEADENDDEWKELFSKPITEKPTPVPQKDQGLPTQPPPSQEMRQRDKEPATQTPATTTPAPTATSPPASTLRNRHSTPATPSSEKAMTTGSNATKPSDKEAALSTHRLEQEDLTSSLLSLASQLKSSSQSFQSTLENEKSALDRAVSGIDRTSTTMEAAGKRMGMLRKMTEGKGWWGRMMLYAWIFGLWVVAILIVYVGPKLRF